MITLAAAAISATMTVPEVVMSATCISTVTRGRSSRGGVPGRLPFEDYRALPRPTTVAGA